MGRTYIHDPEGFVSGVGVPDVEGVEGVDGGGVVGDRLVLACVSHR